MSGSNKQRLDQFQVGGDHYNRMEITPWEFLQSCLTPEEFRGYLKGEAIVYIARELAKAGPVDIGKARHTLQKLEEVYKVQPPGPPPMLCTVPSVCVPQRACAKPGECQYGKACHAFKP